MIGMKKQLGLGLLAAMLLLSACSEEADQDEGEMSKPSEPGVEEAATETEENEGKMEGESQLISGEEAETLQDERVHSSPEEIHDNVKNVIASGHEAMIAYNNLRGWEEAEAVENLMAEMDELIPEIEEAMEYIEDTALMEDFQRIHRVSQSFIEKIENDQLTELEWRSRTSELRNVFQDLDYYVRGAEENEPYNVTQYAHSQLNQMFQEDSVQEDFKKLSEATKVMIENAPSWHKEPFVQNSDFRQAIVEADAEKEGLSIQDIDFLLSELESGDVTADEAVEAFLEERM